MFNLFNLKHFFCIVIWLIFSQQELFATSGNAIINGDWDDAPTWLFGSTNRKPGCSDTVVIGASRTVTVNSQENLFPCGAPNIIYVYGILQFTNGNKLDLPCNSLVIIMPGGLVKKATAGGGNSTLISICGTVEWKAGDGPIGGPDTLGIHSTLPVELLSFHGVLKDGRVDLDWTTLTEINNDRFVVTRSADAYTFENIGSVAGAGNSTETNNYVFTDHHPLQGVSYYQLHQVDFNGSTSRSQIIAINTKSSLSGFGNLYVNPASGASPASALFNAGMDGTSMLEIHALSGSLIYSSELQYQEGANYIELPVLNNLASGVYFARIYGDGDPGCYAKFFVPAH